MAEGSYESIESSSTKLPIKYEATKAFKKYPVGCDVDKELIFNFPFLLHEGTVSYIEDYTRIMFIIRGPPSTGKAALSEMLRDKYPDAAYCCADRYFTNTFSSARRTQESIKDSHIHCQKKVEKACKDNTQTIIVQNTHMRKWEMQIYLDFAALYNYTVVMAITLYRFDCTPKALAENNTDGLDIPYFKNRLRQWEDVPPLFTGWFVSPNDSLHILHHLMKSLDALLGDGKFCRVLNVYDTDDIRNYFKPRRSLCCLAGYIKNQLLMKSYYLSDEVQASYGRCFSLSIFGYLISTTSLVGIVSVDTSMKPLLASKEPIREAQYSNMNSLNLSENLEHFSTTTFFPKDELSEETTVSFEDCQDSENSDTATFSFIDLAQKDDKLLDVEAVRKDFLDNLKFLINEDGSINCDDFTELDCDEDNKFYRLENNLWLIKPLQKMKVKSIFTGLYV